MGIAAGSAPAAIPYGSNEVQYHVKCDNMILIIK